MFKNLEVRYHQNVITFRGQHQHIIYSSLVTWLSVQ